MSFLSSTVTVILIVINVALFLLETKDGGSTKTEVALKYGAQYTRASITGSLPPCSCTSGSGIFSLICMRCRFWALRLTMCAAP